MSNPRRWIGALLFGAGAALGVYSQLTAARVEGERALQRQLAAAALEEAHRAEAEDRRLEARAERAAALKPLIAAVGSHIDGPTLIDLFAHEDWWQPFRGEFASARVIVGNGLLGAWGTFDPGAIETPLVQAARKGRVNSVRSVI